MLSMIIALCAVIYTAVVRAMEKPQLPMESFEEVDPVLSSMHSPFSASDVPDMVEEATTSQEEPVYDEMVPEDIPAFAGEEFTPFK